MYAFPIEILRKKTTFFLVSTLNSHGDVFLYSDLPDFSSKEIMDFFAKIPPPVYMIRILHPHITKNPLEELHNILHNAQDSFIIIETKEIKPEMTQNIFTFLSKAHTFIFLVQNQEAPPHPIIEDMIVFSPEPQSTDAFRLTRKSDNTTFGPYKLDDQTSKFKEVI